MGLFAGLPHQLIEAFKSTLNETAEADLLLHVVDAASPARAEQMAEVESVLREIGADKVPTIIVYNKIDMSGRAPAVERDSRDNIVAVSVSAQSGLGLELLRGSIVEFIERSAGGDDCAHQCKTRRKCFLVAQRSGGVVQGLRRSI